MKVSINTGTTKNIMIKNTGGNTGSFINPAELTGPNKDKFLVKPDVDLTLVGANVHLDITIVHLGNKTGEIANLHIIYNGDTEEKIGLISE